SGSANQLILRVMLNKAKHLRPFSGVDQRRRFSRAEMVRGSSLRFPALRMTVSRIVPVIRIVASQSQHDCQSMSARATPGNLLVLRFQQFLLIAAALCFLLHDTAQAAAKKVLFIG